MDYKDTLNLPKTDFPMRGNLPNREPEIIAQWEEDNLYKQLLEQNKDNTPFILHDGPPYANGNIHMGHAINKVLKDIIIRMRSMEGRPSPYVPGWDCHGLPIEHQVDKELGKKKRDMSTAEFRSYCREYAQKYVDIQSDEFKRLGIMGQWEDPYLTMTFDYEAQIVRELGRFMEAGSVYLGLKPVYWCSSCRTALAEAEVEYADKTSSSIYVKFPFATDLGELAPELAGKKVSVVIWTTTPWTIPANLAVALGPDFEDGAYELASGEVLILASRLAPVVLEEAGEEGWKEIAKIDPNTLENLEARHPLYDRASRILLGDHVTLEAGTGCVHTAPGHGQEDYEIGLKYGIEAYAPVDAAGRFTEEVGEPLAGLKVLDANGQVIELLEASGHLLAQGKLAHSYPHCWRCKRPVIFRSTPQWFISMDNTGLRGTALEEIDKVEWIPGWGRERIKGMIATRPDWCISRQRRWGVPIVAAHCAKCNEVYASKEMAYKAADYFEAEGADAWYERPIEDFMPQGTSCTKCGATEFEKETDILDVWFDSGVSHAAVVENRDNLSSPADLYLEGSDQHRGWFHSSLLTSVGTRNVAPYRSVLTHGFVVDGKGKKMSKSFGNVIAPEKIIKRRGAEILRLWVAAEDYRDDIRVSEEILKQLEDAYRRIRNTSRFMLGNLSDFDPAKHTVEYSELWEIDRFALDLLNRLVDECRKAYDSYEFHGIFHKLHNFCAVDLSAFYLDILKDRLYTFPTESQGRRSAQTVLLQLIDKLARLMAPVLCFTSEDIWKHIPGTEGSIHLARLPEVDSALNDDELAERWQKLRELRKLVTKSAEERRASKEIGHSLDAKITLHLDDRWESFLSPYQSDLPFIFIVSQVDICEGEGGEFTDPALPGVGVDVGRAEGEKCSRCWNYATDLGTDAEHPEVCGRCAGHL